MPLLRKVAWFTKLFHIIADLFINNNDTLYLRDVLIIGLAMILVADMLLFYYIGYRYSLPTKLIFTTDIAHEKIIYLTPIKKFVSG